MKRKLQLLVLVAGMLLSISVPALAGATDTGFSDVSPDAWYVEGVSYCQGQGFMSGTSAAAFEPDEPMSRAMLVTVLYRGKNSLGGGRLNAPSPGSIIL